MKFEPPFLEASRLASWAFIFNKNSIDLCHFIYLGKMFKNLLLIRKLKKQTFKLIIKINSVYIDCVMARGHQSCQFAHVKQTISKCK